MSYFVISLNPQGEFDYIIHPELRVKLINHHIDRLKNSKGEEKINNLEGLIALTKNYDNYLWAWSLWQLGLNLQQIDSINADVNFERAIRSYELALTIFNLENHPENYVTLRSELGTAYLFRKKGIYTSNIEKAIELYFESLNLVTKASNLDLWGVINNNLGLAFMERLDGDQNDNIEKSIDFFNNAISIRTEENRDLNWIKAHLNLGLLYNKRLRENKGENLKKSLEYFSKALKFLDKDQHEKDYILTLNHIGNVYLHFAKLGAKDAIGDAIKYYDKVLKIATKESYPSLWANANQNMGLAYEMNHKGDKLSNLRSATFHFNSSLEVFKKENFPEDWATAQINLVRLYDNLKRFDCLDLIAEAIKNSQKALEILNSNKSYYKHVYLSLCLGNIQMKKNNFQEAKVIFEKAHEFFEEIRSKLIHEESSKILSVDYAMLSSHLVFCSIKTGDFEKALIYSLSNKNRTLINSINVNQKSEIKELISASKDFKNDWSQLEEIHSKLDNLTSKFHHPNFCGDIDALSKEIDITQKELNIETANIVFKYPSLLLYDASSPTLLENDLKLLLTDSKDFVVVEYVHHFGGLGVFVIVEGVIHYFDLCGKKLPYNVAESVRLLIEDKLWDVKDLESRLIETYDLLVQPFEHLLLKKNIVISPVGPLFFVPFQALINNKGEYLSENHILKIIPNLTLIKSLTTLSLLELSERNKLQKGLVVVNPDLKGTTSSAMKQESKNLDNKINNKTLIQGVTSTISNVMSVMNDETYDVVHFIGHGEFKPNDPSSSGLILSNGTILSVNDVKLKGKLQGHPLVVLSACQTGQIRFDLGNESIGLPFAFLVIGASNVICSQWSVKDVSTKELFYYFYFYLKNSNLTYSEALNLAMKKVRNIPKYRNPKFWAGFNVFGLN